MKVNDILVCEWGHGQTNVDFYQVVKATEKTVLIRKIKGKSVGESGYLVGHVVPIIDAFKAAPIRKKIGKWDSGAWEGREYLMIESYALAMEWDGKPVRYSGYY